MDGSVSDFVMAGAAIERFAVRIGCSGEPRDAPAAANVKNSVDRK
jgi:hypothetical protein